MGIWRQVNGQVDEIPDLVSPCCRKGKVIRESGKGVGVALLVPDAGACSVRCICVYASLKAGMVSMPSTLRAVLPASTLARYLLGQE